MTPPSSVLYTVMTPPSSVLYTVMTPPSSVLYNVMAPPFSVFTNGGESSKVVVGVLLLGIVSFLLLALFLFLSIGISFGKLLQYREIHHEGRIIHWYRDIVRVTLGPGKRGQWTWKNKPNSIYLTMLGPLFEDLRGPPKYMLSQISVGNPRKRGSQIIPSDDENEDAEAPFIQKVFGILRIYYTLLESVKRVCLGIIAGAYSERWTFKTPTVALLCVASFQLFFLVLKKPFIKKKVQMVEIISVCSEVGIFAICFVLLEMEFSTRDETKIGIFMLSLFLVTFLAQMTNEWYALYRQTKRLDPSEESLLLGLRNTVIGFLVLFISQNLIKTLESRFLMDQRVDGEPGDTTSSGDKRRSSGSRSSGTTDKPWLKQLREMAKASFSRDGSGAGSRAPNDPSTSGATKSGFWSGKRSGSSSQTSPADFKLKPTENVVATPLGIQLKRKKSEVVREEAVRPTRERVGTDQRNGWGRRVCGQQKGSGEEPELRRDGRSGQVKHRWRRSRRKRSLRPERSRHFKAGEKPTEKGWMVMVGE
ncbi:hypothetical protein TEA_012470 [Camellia sinensis var. sinensis]|uniref:TRP C-terminal domain-containing protein n=1 Tax=Camellia sinensis var. sinensis TaxID=542762 RepID=A0A4V3WQ39_CAMSN|nr:hypothetical protein TEA_012470 [Camellia sinensis var. sinensis]